LKEGGEWNARKYGFSYVTDKASRPELNEAEQGVHRETIRKWVDEATKSPELETIYRMLLFINTFLDVPEPLIPADLTDDVPLALLCAKLRYRDEDFFRSEYSSHYEKFGPQNDYVLRDDELIESQVGILRALYHVYRREPSNGRKHGGVTRLGIAVVGAVPVTDHANEKDHAIVALLSIPSISDSKPYLYTGAVAYRHSLMSWNFLQENSPHTDVAFFLTDKGDTGRKDLERKGHLLTMSQYSLGNQQSFGISISYKVLIRRVKKEFSFNDVEKFLAETAKFNVTDLDKDGLKWLE
jgi:hypothetical protein